MLNEHHLSERHACALVGLSRDTYRHVTQTSALNVELREQIMHTAHTRRRWGYRMIHDVLRPQYSNINHKRVYRLYTAEGLSIRKRKKAKRVGVRVPLVAALAVNQTWSLDFVSDAIAKPGQCHGASNASRWQMTSATNVWTSAWTLALAVPTSPGCWTGPQRFGATPKRSGPTTGRNSLAGHS